MVSIWNQQKDACGCVSIPLELQGTVWLCSRWHLSVHGTNFHHRRVWNEQVVFCTYTELYWYPWLPISLAARIPGCPYPWLPVSLAARIPGCPYPWLPVSLAAYIPGCLYHQVTSFTVVAISIFFSLSIYRCHKSRHAPVVM